MRYYAKQDERIRVVHRANGGLGPARNSGIEVARGEYIGFVDSDDWIEPDMYERLYDAASSTGAQVVFTGMKTIRHGEVAEVREHPYAERVLIGDEEIFRVRRTFFGSPAERVKDDPTPLSVWVAGYRRSFIEDNALRFRNVRSEDRFFNTEACRAADIVACISGTPYCYRKDDQPSITKTFSRDTIDSFFRLFRLLEQLADEEREVFFDESQLRTKRCIIDCCRVLIRMIEASSSEDDEKSAYVRDVCNHSSLRRAVDGFPFWRIPLKQAVFYLCLRLRLTRLARGLARVREGRQ